MLAQRDTHRHQTGTHYQHSLPMHPDFLHQRSPDSWSWVRNFLKTTHFPSPHETLSKHYQNVVFICILLNPLNLISILSHSHTQTDAVRMRRSTWIAAKSTAIGGSLIRLVAQHSSAIIRKTTPSSRCNQDLYAVQLICSNTHIHTHTVTHLLGFPLTK